MRNVLLVSFSLLFISVSCVNAQKESDNIPKIIAEAFFDNFGKNNIPQAVDDLFATNKENNDSILIVQINSLKQSLNQMSTLFGKYYGYELITKKALGADFIYYSYLVKFKKQPVRFIFMFYNTDKKWKIYKFKYDIELEDELEEAGKLYFLEKK